MKDVYIFGRGKNFIENEENIKKDYRILGFLDNAVENEEYDESRSCYVFSPNAFSDIQDIFILIVSQYFIDMWRQLRSLGVENSQIEFYQTPKVRIDFDNDILFLEDGKNRFYFSSQQEYKIALRNWAKNSIKDLQSIISLDIEPVSRIFGIEYGTPVDRYYIDEFLSNNTQYIYGTVLEIAENTYTKRYGKEVKKSIVSHVKGWNGAYTCDFETGEGVIDEMVDCIICTQTLQYIYNLKSAIHNIYRMLKKGGAALITVPGIKSLSVYDDYEWGEKWSFTEKSLYMLCKEVASATNISIKSYGNAKVATAYLYGICYEFLEDELRQNDKQYPFLITATLMKE